MGKHYRICLICGIVQLSHTELKFFKIPVDSAKRNRWLVNINRSDLINKKIPQDKCICELHFKLHMFGKKRLLRKNAVPCVDISSMANVDTCNETNEKQIIQCMSPSSSTVNSFEVNTEELPESSEIHTTSRHPDLMEKKCQDMLTEKNQFDQSKGTKAINRLPLDQRVKAIRTYERTLNYQEVAQRFKCTAEHIRNIVKNKQRILVSYASKLLRKQERRIKILKKKRAKNMILFGEVMQEWFGRARRHPAVKSNSNKLLPSVALRVKQVLNIPQFDPNKTWLTSFRHSNNITNQDIIEANSTDSGPISLNINNIIKYIQQRKPEDPSSEESCSESSTSEEEEDDNILTADQTDLECNETSLVEPFPIQFNEIPQKTYSRKSPRSTIKQSSKNVPNTRCNDGEKFSKEELYIYQLNFIDHVLLIWLRRCLARIKKDEIFPDSLIRSKAKEIGKLLDTDITIPQNWVSLFRKKIDAGVLSIEATETESIRLTDIFAEEWPHFFKTEDSSIEDSDTDDEETTYDSIHTFKEAFDCLKLVEGYAQLVQNFGAIEVVYQIEEIFKNEGCK